MRAALLRRDQALRAALEEVLAKDAEWRAATTAAETLRAEQREHSERIAAQKRGGADVEPELARMKQLSADAKARAEQARVAEQQLQASLALLPNLPDPSAAPGPGDDVLREVGEIPELSFEPRDHLELAGPMIDTERAAKVSGSRFAYLKGELVALELALVSWALDKLAGHGFEPVIPPVLVRERALFGTGFLPDTEQQIYRLAEDELYLLGTSEVALASLHDGEIIEQDRLPLRYAGFSPCFRREAGAAGKDTRGIFRVHQFDKVEMFSFVRPQDSEAEHERLLAIEEEIFQALGVPYRVVNIAAWDLGASAAKKYDLEAWMPGQERYREVTSTSNTTDFQARRLGVRYRPAEGASPRFGHTLNGTATTWRTMIAIAENGQRDDGTVEVPEVLHAYGAPPTLTG